MKSFLKAIVVGLLIVFIAFPALAFDKTPGKLFEWDNRATADDGKKYVDLTNTVVQIMVVGSAIGQVGVYNREIGEFELHAALGSFVQTGEGFVVKGIDGKLYIITCSHIVTPNEIRIELTNFSGIIVKAIKLVNRMVFVGGNNGTSYECNVLINNEKDDWAILQPKGNAPALTPFSPPLSYTIFRSENAIGDMIHKGDAIGIVTNIRIQDESGTYKSTWYEIRYGKIISDGPHVPDIKMLPWFGLMDITIDAIIYPGDSGSPVIAWIDGNPVLIGIARAIYNDGTYQYGYFVRIDHVTSILNTKDMF